MSLTHRERLQACLKNDPALDRPPVALWRHFPVDDQVPESLAAAVIDFQGHYDFDLVKVTPASSFCLKDWGVEDVWEGHTEGTRRYTKSVVHSPKDWERLKVLDPRKAGNLAAQVDCLRRICAGLGPDVPVLQTVFSPLAQAKHLVEADTLAVHLRLYPEAVLKGLATIAETTRRFVEACLETDIDGIFYAVQHAQAGVLSLEEYKTFGLPADRTVMKAAKPLWCNLLHLHGSDVYFDLLLEYPVQIVNWHDRETPPSLAEAQKRFAGIVCGGISQETIVFGDGSQVRKEAADAIRQTRGRRLLLGTGCVVPVIAPQGNILAARQSVGVAR
ncbi:MAG TPA: uroporphyrinogen decarboxylase family protein [Anaerolineales bacterium]|nr:uroporphyrinogen decarboxylase family protein [Anaerolineales bacterium]